MVFLGFGKYVRADRIYALEPIVGDDRGNGRRTLVWVEGIPEPIVASRTQETILEEMGEPRSRAAGRRRSRPRRADAAPAALRPPRLTLAELRRGERPRRRAPALLGWTLLVDGVGGRIVEVEAYAEDDAASHSFRGRTTRNGIDVRRAGALYVYRSYGIHWCANVVCEEAGRGAAVLLRALEPTHGLDEMRAPPRARRPAAPLLGPGPADPGARDHGRPRRRSSLAEPPFALVPPAAPVEFERTPRIGISRAVELPWRYVEAGTRAGRAAARRAA